MNILNIIKNLIKNGKQKKVPKDSGNVQKVQCSFLGQEKDIKQITPYGFYSSSVIGSNWIIFSSRANSDDLQGIGNDYKNRPKNLKEGEVVLQNLLTGAYIKLDSVGNINVVTTKDIIASAANITATATNNITATATTKITATAPAIDLNGYVKITGGLEVDGIVFGTHVHPENDNGGPTGPPQ